MHCGEISKYILFTGCMYISIYQDVDAVNPAKIGAEVSVNSTVDGNYQTCMVSNNPISSKW